MKATKGTQIIILGGTGDLSQRKLLPALLDLYMRNMLPDKFHIIGLGRSPLNTTGYREFVMRAIAKFHFDHTHTTNKIEKFIQHFSYVSGSFDDPSSYIDLQTAIDLFDSNNKTRSNRLFYLAVAPNFYEQILTDLKSSGLAEEDNSAWTRVLVEKPFGNDLRTAQALDAKFASLYHERQIFRIDHYLAKEAVQNILSFRFANTLLKAPWSNDSIKSVEITMFETIDVGHRAGFYESIGALRDVGQNHLLQLLALVAMKEPASFTADSIRLARTEILEALHPINLDNIDEHVLRAQYEGYRATENIANDSNIETYFELKATIDLPEWEDVPFYIRAGKALNTSEVSIVINFDDIASGIFETDDCTSVGNKITLTISPEQTIAITLNAKTPGLGYQLGTRTLAFTCEKGEKEIKNSYEKVLYDSIIGDQTLFTSTGEVLAAWKFITPILENWSKTPLHSYPKGSQGPEASIIPT